MFNPFAKFFRHFIKNGYSHFAFNLFFLLLVFFKARFYLKLKWQRRKKKYIIKNNKLVIKKNLNQWKKNNKNKKWNKNNQSKWNNNIVNINKKNIINKQNVFNKKKNHDIIKKLYYYFLQTKVKKNKYLKNYIFWHLNPLFIFQGCVNKIKPVLTTFPKIISRKTQHIPIILKKNEEYRMLFNWLSKLLNKKYSNYSLKFLLFHYNFCYEILLIYYKKKSYLFKIRKKFYDSLLKNRNLLKYLR